MTVLQYLVISGAAALTSVILFLVFARIWKPEPSESATFTTPVAFLFERGALIHATPIANTLIDDVSPRNWAGIREKLLIRFPALPAVAPATGADPLEVEASDPEDPCFLRVETVRSKTRVELIEPEENATQGEHDIQNIRLQYDRLVELCQAAPYPVWRVDEEGAVVWANAAHDLLAERTGRRPEDSHRPVLKIPHVGAEQRRSRASSVFVESGRAAWFDVTATPAKSGVIYHAVNIDAIIQAEIAQRNFVQTLAKTFAQLSIGLAIFDRNGQLALFNPALIDLTGLPAEFLSARPELVTFFDRLRDRRAMPEPKNYASWRVEIGDMVKAASETGYQETWTLESGYTYRITGRPHPDGAVAFLIEDISAEVSLTRNFRAELEIGQSLLDSFDEGLAVFAASGVLTFCNTAYRKMWQVDPESSFADTTIMDSLQLWQGACEPNTAWGDLRDFIMTRSERAPWENPVRRKDGTQLLLRVTPVAAGATSVRFDPVSARIEPALPARP